MASEAAPGGDAVAALRTRLGDARRALLAALEGVTEREFGAEIDGETVSAILAALALDERRTVTRARRAAGAEERPPPPAAPRSNAANAVPPQLIHDLAGARYETALLLETLRDEDLARSDGDATAGALLEGLAAREEAAAARVASRAGADRSGA